MANARNNHIRILFVDNHALVRAGFRKLIESQSGMSIVGEAGNAADAVAIAAQEHPDIILFAPNLKDYTKLDLIRQLIAAAENSRVILVTDNYDSQLHQQAIGLGAMGVVLKDQPADVLIKAITKVHAGEAWVGRMLMANVISNLSRAQMVENADPHAAAIASLSPREREVITLIGQGLKNKQIAEQLFISETTVRHHLTAIFAKLHVSDRLELMIYAYQHGLATLPP